MRLNETLQKKNTGIALSSVRSSAVLVIWTMVRRPATVKRKNVNSIVTSTMLSECICSPL